jgi:hypothetical protein
VEFVIKVNFDVSINLNSAVFEEKNAVLCVLFSAGLWIRIDLMRIRIQHFCSIRIQAKTELSKTISFSNFFKSKI